ncbi:hypothetical protein M8Z33_03695 [Streptomyces sp. ZAF1911]|nr:hypothetical protein [Streptomyces sp. ZAF1911]MDD9375787.1 hypothetical protein [Streptomyces sp. ZAF1911]
MTDNSPEARLSSGEMTTFSGVPFPVGISATTVMVRASIADTAPESRSVTKTFLAKTYFGVPRRDDLTFEALAKQL